MRFVKSFIDLLFCFRKFSFVCTNRFLRFIDNLFASRLLAGVGEGFPDVLLGVAIAAGNAHFVNSWIPKVHPLATAEGCGTQVRERGLHGAENHVFRPVLAQSQSSPTWLSQKGLVFGVKAFTTPPLC